MMEMRLGLLALVRPGLLYVLKVVHPMEASATLVVWGITKKGKS